MAEAQQSLLKNSSSIENIQKSLNAFGVGLRKANSTSSTIIKSLYEGNREKKRAIIKQRELFQKRREAVRRREQEDVIEAGKVGSVYRRTTKVISGSTKGFLGRIMDFVGTIMLGWLVNNLPIIIDGSRKLIERIQNLTGVLSSWTNGLGNFFVDFTAQLGGILTRNNNLSIDKDKRDADNAENRLFNGVRRVIQDMEQMITNLLEFDLIGILGLKANASEIDSTRPPGRGAPQPGTSGGGGNLRPLLNLISSGESPGGGYSAMFPSESYPQILDMSISEVIAFQKEKLKDGRRSAAIGRYQMLFPEKFAAAAGLPLTAKFSPENQDKMVIAYLRKNRKLDLWLEGRITDEAFSEELAREFGAFKSASGFVLPGNTGSIGFNKLKPVLQQIKRSRSRDSAPAPMIDQNVSYRVGQDISTIVGAAAKITSLKGEMRSGGPHGGLDIACSTGLYISLRGVDAEVVGTASQAGYGLVIDIWVPSLGVQLRFAHNSQILVRSGKIPAGTSFAVTGSTGRSTGPHIHLEADTMRGAIRGGGNISPNPYVSLIRLTNAKIEGVRSEVPSISAAPTRAEVSAPERTTNVSERVTRGSKEITIPVPIPFDQIDPTQPPPQGGIGGPSLLLGGGNQLNTFVTKTLLRELEYV